MRASERVVAAFGGRFGRAPALVARAPGRVNLIGEHTDYSGGFVLPIAIDRDVCVAARAVDGGVISAVAADAPGELRFEAGGAYAADGPEWGRYVRAVARVLADAGVPVSGAELAVAGDVPLGSGLSSSAALEVACALALLRLAGVDWPPVEVALAAQQAEHLVGVQCGIMDQLVSAGGRGGHALAIDCRDLSTRAVAMPAGAAVVVAHSGVKHALADGEYNRRRAECEAAARHYGVALLRDLDEARLRADAAGLDAVAFARAEHVVTENARVGRAADALAAGDLRAMGALLREGHASLRDRFEVTVPAVDALQAVMDAACGGEGGARMTGGGFGGCVIALVAEARAVDVLDAVARGYRAPDGRAAETFVVRASDGAGVTG